MDNECQCQRIVRLEVQNRPYWICTLCNAQYVPKAAVDWKIEHLTRELGGRMIDEQAT